MKEKSSNKKNESEGSLPERASAKSPFPAISQMHKEMDRLFENFFNGWQQDLEVSGILPNYKMRKTDSHYLLSVDVPGMSKENLKIESQENCLHIFGEKSAKEGEEQTYMNLSRWITLPADVKLENIEASLDGGVLQVAVPRAEKKNLGEIDIKEGKDSRFRIGHKKETAA